MRKCRSIFLVLALGAVTVCGQPRVSDLPVGTTLVIELRKSVRADRARPGDEVKAKVIVPVLQSGAIIIPQGAIAVGIVVEARPVSVSAPSRLAIRFQQVQWKGGGFALNAFPVRQLVLKRKYDYESRTFCPPVQRFLGTSSAQQQTTSPSTQQSSPPAAAAPSPAPGGLTTDLDDVCHNPVGARRDSRELQTFTTPSTTSLTLRRLASPSGATVLESANKDVVLPKGMIWEIEQMKGKTGG